MGFSLQIFICLFCTVYLVLAGMNPSWIARTATDPGGYTVQDDTVYFPVIAKAGMPRGYLTTPQELAAIKTKIARGVEPYKSASEAVSEWADKAWDYDLKANVTCGTSNRPQWIDNQGGVPKLYARALAYHLTGETRYARETKDILEKIMTNVETISIEDQQCRLNFGWGTPELVAAADLIEEYWGQQSCTGPLSTKYGDTQVGKGKCKRLFQNWLVKNPYYVVSYSTASLNNWGTAATNTTAYIADYLWDRPEVHLLHRVPRQINQGVDLVFTPSEAYAHANHLMLDRMNGYAVDYISSDACDYLNGAQQDPQWLPVKSQITENGIVPDDARRDEHCNIPVYNGVYQNYPQIHLGNNIQQCELMLRRGDSSCYDNVDKANLPNYTFLDPNGVFKTTKLAPGRGSIERAIKAVIVDSATEWRHDSALAVAYRYYYNHHKLAGFEKWSGQLDTYSECAQDICFGMLTHGLAAGEAPPKTPTVAEP